jgi:hypothetical protein
MAICGGPRGRLAGQPAAQSCSARKVVAAIGRLLTTGYRRAARGHAGCFPVSASLPPTTPHLVLNLLGRVIHEDRAVGVTCAHLPALALQRREEARLDERGLFVPDARRHVARHPAGGPRGGEGAGQRARRGAVQRGLSSEWRGEQGEPPAASLGGASPKQCRPPPLRADRLAAASAAALAAAAPSHLPAPLT